MTWTLADYVLERAAENRVGMQFEDDEWTWAEHAQISADPLLSIERFAIGGRDTVRGYRENQLVRDSGVVASAELRIPLWRDSLRRPLLELVPFMDYGTGWNDGPEPPDDTPV